MNEYDEEMMRDYDWHENTGDLPEFFDEDGEIFDPVEVRVRCPLCGHRFVMTADASWDWLECDCPRCGGFVHVNL